jgi:hypothetical protein
MHSRPLRCSEGVAENATPGEALLASCYEAGADHNADEATRAVIALPAAVQRRLQLCKFIA